MFEKRTSTTYTDNSATAFGNNDIYYNKETREVPVKPTPDYSVAVAGVIFTICCLMILSAIGSAFSKLPTPVFREQPNRPVERLNS